MRTPTKKYFWWADFLCNGRISRTYNPEAFASQEAAERSMESATRFRSEYGGAIRVNHGFNTAFVGDFQNMRAM